MKKVTIQLVVATLITVAFVVTARERPRPVRAGTAAPRLRYLAARRGAPSTSGRALVLTVAVVAHIVLNRRRVGEMVVRLWRPAGPPRPARRLPGDRRRRRRRAMPPRAAGARSRLRLSRRRFLWLSAGVVAAAARAPWVLEPAPAPVAPAGLAPPRGRAVSSSGFPVLDIEGRPPACAPGRLGGRGRRSRRQPALHLDRSAWLALPRTQETRTFHCVEGWSVDHLGWEGVRVADLLSLAKPQAGAGSSPSTPTAARYSDSLPWPRPGRPRRCWPTPSTPRRCRRRTGGRCASSSLRSSATRT